MFDFDDDYDPDADDWDLRTSYGRYHDRIEGWKIFNPRTGWLRHHFWWMIHNIPVHVLIGLFPFKPLFMLHDWTSSRLGKYQ